MSTVRSLIHKVIHIELRQIKHLAMLGSVAPDEFTRDLILQMIQEETGEAKFWNTVDAAYRDACPEMPCPEVGMCPGTGMDPGMGMSPGMGMDPGMGMSPGMGMGSGMTPPAGPEVTFFPPFMSGEAGAAPAPLPEIFSEPEKKEDKK